MTAVRSWRRRRRTPPRVHVALGVAAEGGSRHRRDLLPGHVTRTLLRAGAGETCADRAVDADTPPLQRSSPNAARATVGRRPRAWAASGRARPPDRTEHLGGERESRPVHERASRRGEREALAAPGSAPRSPRASRSGSRRATGRASGSAAARSARRAPRCRASRRPTRRVAPRPRRPAGELEQATDEHGLPQRVDAQHGFGARGGQVRERRADVEVEDRAGHDAAARSPARARRADVRRPARPRRPDRSCGRSRSPRRPGTSARTRAGPPWRAAGRRPGRGRAPCSRRPAAGGRR